MLGEPKNQFSLTRAALSTCGRAKSKFLSVVVAGALISISQLGASEPVRNTPLFGEWLIGRVRGRAIRLVIEQMSDASTTASAARADLATDSSESAQISFSSGSQSWPWKAAADDHDPSITWTYPNEVEFSSLKVEQTSKHEWVRRYRVELSTDGKTWRTVVPSKWIDCYHREPCRLPNSLHVLDSSLLPPGVGTRWANSFFEDFMYRAIEKLGPDSDYQEYLTGEYFLAAAAHPFPFGGVYNSGDAGNFDALIAAILSPEMAVETQKLFPDLINRYGYMPGVMSPGKGDGALMLDYSGTTWGPCCYWDIFAWTQDKQYLGWFTDSCAKWARWWKANRDRNHDGWLEPGVNACKPSTPEFRAQGAKDYPGVAKLCPDFWDYTGVYDQACSAMLLSIYEEPWDDAGRWVVGRHRGLKFDPKTCSLNVHFIETQLYISMLNSFVADSLTRLGHANEAKLYAKEAQRLSALVAKNCWDEKTGFYYDCDADTGKRRTFVKHAGAYVSMMMGLPTMDQAKRMVSHLTNPKEFWTAYPVPTISVDSPDYVPTGYWSGRAWPPVDFFVLRGLLNYGFFDQADELLKRWMALAKTCSGDHHPSGTPDVKWIVPENWNPETGDFVGSNGLTWGGLWLPAVIIRNFWPVGEHSAILRPGGHLHLVWGNRWKVDIDGDHALVNGRSFKLPEKRSYLLDESTGKIHPLEPGKSDPVVLSRLGLAK